jgi:hypothetical protein
MKKVLFSAFAVGLCMTASVSFNNHLHGQITFQSATQSSINVPTGRNFKTLIDINNDNFEDFFAQNSSNGNLELYLNNSNGTFSNQNLGFTRNVTNAILNQADFNNDGYQDVVILYNDSIFFYRNLANNSFQNITNSLGSLNPLNRQYNLAATPGFWDDYDADNDLDFIFSSKNTTNSYIEVLINNGTNFGRTTLLTFTLPIVPMIIPIDYDNDKDQDLLLLNFNDNNPPFSQYNYQSLKLYQKNNTTYNDVTVGSGLGLGSNHGFASTWDYNNDGYLDIIMGSTDNVFNSSHVNRVYKNMGNGIFSDVSTQVNVKNGNVYYRSVDLVDFDNNGDQDVFYSASNHLFANDNAVFSSDLISSSGLPGLAWPAVTDLNNDGKMDIIFNDLTSSINISSSGDFLKIKLIGCPNLKDPRGTLVKLYGNGEIKTRYLIGGDSPYGYTGSNSNILHFGLGNNYQIDSLKVEWVNGVTTKHTNLTVNSLNTIYQNNSCNSMGSNCIITIYDTIYTNITTYDTTYVTINDTLLTTVTDTLIINTTLSLPAPNNENTILIYPNPASDHITIDNGNFSAMAGYSIKIENNAGQQVFQSLINQAQFYVDLSTWTGNGLYFVHLIDPQNNTVTVRKIVLQ